LFQSDNKLSQVNPWILLFLECLWRVVFYKHADVADQPDSISESRPQSYNPFVLDPFGRTVCPRIYLFLFPLVSSRRTFYTLAPSCSSQRLHMHYRKKLTFRNAAGCTNYKVSRYAVSPSCPFTYFLFVLNFVISFEFQTLSVSAPSS
jgi:hypothetical protein